MKIIANNFNEQDIMRMIREWTELTQKDFAKTVNRSRDGIQKYESGKRKYTFETFMTFCKIHNIKITLEKEK
ncbi:MAG: helix-turn-helix transcriptional regulator [Bacilli bacterium]